MLNVGVIGVGNAGNQVAALAQEELKVPVLAINSSEKDLETLPSSVPKKLIRDANGVSHGAGKDRALAKKYLKDSAVALIADDDFKNIITDLDVVFVASSTGGGTGSGTAIMVADIIKNIYKDVLTIIIGILPVMSEAKLSHVNTLSYLDDITKLSDPYYMLYDNERFNNLASYQILEKVNSEIIHDIDVLRCRYNYTTKYDSIDDKDMIRLLSNTPGRIVLARLDSFKDKDCDNTTIEDMVIDALKKSAHVELQRDKKVACGGLITNLSETLSNEFKSGELEKVHEFIGEPNSNFTHTYINEDRHMPNSVFYILSGLSPINDKIYKINDRIREIDESRKLDEEDDPLHEMDLNELNKSLADKGSSNDETEFSLNKLLDKYM